MEKHKAYLFLGEDNWETIDRWFLIKKIKEGEYDKWHHNHTPNQERCQLYFNKALDSPKLLFNKGQRTFRFYPSEPRVAYYNNCKMTLSHLFAQEVITNIVQTKLTTNKNSKKSEATIKIDHVVKEKALYVNSENPTYPYYADLMVYFSEPADLALRWGGRFVLEIVKHCDISYPKKEDFLQNGIPLVRLNMNSRFILEKTSKFLNETSSTITEEKETEFKEILYYIFSKNIFGNMIVDPTSREYLESKALIEKDETIRNYEVKISDYVNKINDLEGDNNSLTSKIAMLKRQTDTDKNLIEELKKELKDKNDRINSKEKELSNLKNRNLLERIINK